MRNRLWKRLTALFCTLSLLLTLSPAVSAAGSPVESRNINRQDYTTYGNVVTSYLYENSDGGVTRVEYTGGELVIEDYDRSYELADSRTIEPGLPVWGGFFAGEDANFVISGQNNSDIFNNVLFSIRINYVKNETKILKPPYY